jgi:hypothetical protein
MIGAPASVVFDLLADPGTHPAIDGTGWVREPLDPQHLTQPGQIFRMGMYHDNHPNKSYEMANSIIACDPPNAIAWKPGQYGPDGNLTFGGWTWRYDLRAAGPSDTEVSLTYDWSAVPRSGRPFEFPPFAPEHLDNSLVNLAGLAVRATGRPLRDSGVG